MAVDTSTRNVTIDDKTYYFNLWPATQGISIGVKILALGGDALGAFIQGQANIRFQERRDIDGNQVLDDEGLPEMEVVKDSENQFIQKATSLLVAKLDDKNVVALVKEILAKVYMDANLKEVINVDQNFKGDYASLVKLLISVIKENNLQGFLQASVTGLI